MITWKNITQNKGHPNLGKSGHICTHDPQPLPLHATNKVTAWEAKKLTYCLIIKTYSYVSP